MSVSLQRELVREMAASTGTTGGSRILDVSLEEINCGNMHEGTWGEEEKKAKIKICKTITFRNSHEMRSEDK
jgi:hypothetical protein